MRLIAMLKRIHDTNFGGGNGPIAIDDVRASLRDAGFEEDADVPAWFRQMIELVD